MLNIYLFFLITVLRTIVTKRIINRVRNLFLNKKISIKEQECGWLLVKQIVRYYKYLYINIIVWITTTKKRM